MSAPFRLVAGGVIWLVTTGAYASPIDHGPAQLGLPQLSSQTEAALDAKIVLGKKLFADKRLSIDGTVSCASCHQPSQAFSDGRSTGQGVGKKASARNTPSLLNVTYLESLFWDGRTNSLEAQVALPLTNPNEHGFGATADVLRRLKEQSEYEEAFVGAFSMDFKSVGMPEIAIAIASYERTLLSGNSAFDRFRYGGNRTALSDAAIRGLALFEGTAHCATCHSIGAQDALFTDQSFHDSPIRLTTAVSDNLGEIAKRVISAHQEPTGARLTRLITTDPDVAELGRFVSTQNPADIGRFRTPSLRNVAVTAPYMHNGSVDNLEQVIDLELYARGKALNYPIALTAREKQDLLAFLNSLTSTPP